MNKRAFLYILGILVFCSCSDNLSTPVAQGWKVSLADTDQEPIVPRLGSYESFKVKIEGGSSHEKILLYSSEPWLKLSNDTLPEDGIVAVETENNEESTRREAIVTFQSIDTPQHTATISISQLSKADDSNNGGNPKEELFIGYGYDIYKSADNQKSVHTLEPILDIQKLKAYSGTDTYELVHDSKVSRSEIKYHTTLSICQFSTELTSANSGTERSIMGCLKDCKDAISYCTSTSTLEQNYGNGTMTKTVYSRTIDKGAIADMQRKNKLQYTFSTGFQREYNKIKYMQGAKRMEAIENLLAIYGTHVILQADLGGKLSYTFTMNKSYDSDSEEEMKQEIDYTLGTLPEADRNKNYQHTVSSRKNADGAITVIGGSASSRIKLMAGIYGLTPSGHLSADDVSNWLASIYYTPGTTSSDNIDVVHFELIPVWDLVAADLRNDFMTATLNMIKRSDCKLSDQMLGTSLYQIDATRTDLTDFSQADDNSTLCRTLYMRSGDQTIPVMEVCQEYVPKIRTDRRVTIAYPIWQKKINMTRGIFLGDGTHTPMRVAFRNGEHYITPLSDYSLTDKVSKLYYINGVLYTEPLAPSFISEDERGRVVKDDVLLLRTIDDNKLHRHPIVKIGSSFWTRDNIDHNMLFTEKPNDRNNNTTRDLLKNNILYTRFQYDVGFWFKVENSWTYGYSPLNSSQEGSTTENNTLWYLPSPKTVSCLYEYIGFNPKALFKGQSSGFNAQFCGYIGYVDILNGRDFSNKGNELRYNKQLCVLASKNTDSKQSPNLLVLNKDYQWQLFNDENLGTEWRRNYYPVRLCRGKYYIFPDLETLKSIEK